MEVVEPAGSAFVVFVHFHTLVGPWSKLRCCSKILKYGEFFVRDTFDSIKMATPPIIKL
jgi:hypothetical protein